MDSGSRTRGGFTQPLKSTAQASAYYNAPRSPLGTSGLLQTSQPFSSASTAPSPRMTVSFDNADRPSAAPLSTLPEYWQQRLPAATATQSSSPTSHPTQLQNPEIHAEASEDFSETATNSLSSPTSSTSPSPPSKTQQLQSSRRLPPQHQFYASSLQSSERLQQSQALHQSFMQTTQGLANEFVQSSASLSFSQVQGKLTRGAEQKQKMMYHSKAAASVAPGGSAYVKTVDMPSRPRPESHVPERFTKDLIQHDVKPQHPCYRTTSHTLGSRAQTSFERPSEYYGQQYKFTKNFGPPVVASGLNTTLPKKPLWEEY